MEIFGPVLSVIGDEDLDEAVAIANDSDYALGGSVCPADPERGLEVARRVQTGSIGVNGYARSTPARHSPVSKPAAWAVNSGPGRTRRLPAAQIDLPAVAGDRT